jgi:hypothetical protein
MGRGHWADIGERRVNRQHQLPGLERQPSLFSPDDQALIDALVDQATPADYEATADLLRLSRNRDTDRNGET